MKRTLAATLPLFAVLITPAMAADTYKVGISAEPYPPFYSPSASGEWSGWEIDFTDALCERLQADCEIVPLAWEGIIPALNTGKIDMIIGSMGITPERAKQIAFSEKYYDTPTGIVAAKGIDMEPTPEGVEGVYLGVQSGSIQENYANRYFADSAADIKVYQTVDEELQDLTAGRIDAVLGDTLAMQPFLESDLGQACCEFRGNVEADPAILGRGVGVGLRQEDDELRSRVNTAIEDLLSDGTYAAISQRYFGDVSIYGE
ncbi:transporter substrate-binding domain-containing protein [Salinicola aestuarinus]|uniref:transporter substrate-binding domain-containing protein n=1 Tax=Salinicola aestuarinus TaxID=1949082 RepID=UPI000DA19F13|nr:transporter substrate-binding domain-containing protein [Salinicola aestuarinus]